MIKSNEKLEKAQNLEKNQVYRKNFVELKQLIKSRYLKFEIYRITSFLYNIFTYKIFL